MTSSISEVSGRSRALIRDLSNLAVLLEILDRVGSIDQAEGEARARMEKSKQDEATARAEADEAIANARAEADTQISGIKAEVAVFEGERSDLVDVLGTLNAHREEAESALLQAQVKLQATNDELARIASRIGG